MQIEKNKVVTISYELASADGEVYDSSEESDNLTYLHGTGFLVPGIETRLEGQAVGFQLDATIGPAEGYGDYDQSLVLKVHRQEFDGKAELEEGLEFEAQVKDEWRVCTITAIDGDQITVDANHPLAGETLKIKATVLAIRDATSDELEHGHVHGEDGHHHHH